MTTEQPEAQAQEPTATPPAPPERTILEKFVRLISGEAKREREAAEAAVQQRQREDQARAAEAQRQHEKAAAIQAAEKERVAEMKRAIKAAQTSDLPLIHFHMGRDKSTRHYAQREHWLAMWDSRKYTHLPVCTGQGEPIIEEDGTARTVPLREVEWASFRAVAVQQPVRVEDLMLAPEVPETTETRSRGPSLGM